MRNLEEVLRSLEREEIRAPMLPVSVSSTPATAWSTQEYARRLVRYKQMDFEYALWLMTNLCVSPRTAFRTALYHSRTKNQWARDDPAFVVVLLYLLLIASAAWSFAFSWRTPLQVIGLFLYVAAVDFLLLGAALATAGWALANTDRHESGPSTAASEWSAAPERREAVEWLYAFDVHCNAFLPLFLLLHVGQYLLLPLLLRPGMLAALASNTLYAAAFSVYHYLTFLGYSELPFLHRCEIFVYPIAGILLVLLLSLPLGLNCTATVAYIYFG